MFITQRLYATHQGRRGIMTPNLIMKIPEEKKDSEDG